MASLKKRFETIAEGEGTGLTFDPLAADQTQFANLPIDQLEPDPDQPRKDVGDIEDLKASISEHGIIQPIIVSVVAEDRYRIIAGERRYTAAKSLELKTVPCLIRTIEEHRRQEVQLIENIHRKELNPIEEATAYKRLMEEFSLSQRDLAARLGKSAATINQTLRILSLPAPILESVQTSEHLSRSILLEIAKLDSEDEQMALFNQAKSGTLTVKAARQTKTKTLSDTTTAPRKTRVPILTKTASVTLVFERDNVSPDDIVEALSEALRIAKREAKSSNVDQAGE